jgi:hypothetical protein
MLAVTVMGTVSLAAVAWAQDSSNFGNTCEVSHYSAQDPIYEPVAGHNHIFFGALAVTNSDTGDTLRGDPTSCNRVDNPSAYWLPEVYSNGSSTPLPVWTRRPRSSGTTPSTTGPAT